VGLLAPFLAPASAAPGGGLSAFAAVEPRHA
jgi:hypothetical protein